MTKPFIEINDKVAILMDVFKGKPYVPMPDVDGQPFWYVECIPAGKAAIVLEWKCACGYILHTCHNAVAACIEKNPTFVCPKCSCVIHFDQNCSIVTVRAAGRNEWLNWADALELVKLYYAGIECMMLGTVVSC